MTKIALLAIAVFSGCAGIMNAGTRESVNAKVKIETDTFKKTAWLNGPDMKASIMKEATKKDKNEWQVHSYSLRAMKDEKSGVKFIQLYVSHQDTDWIFFDNAVDSDGTKLEFLKIDQRASSGTQYGVGVVEDFAITLPEKYLTDKSQSGFQIRAYGKNGRRAVNVPPFYIQGFIDRYQDFAKK